MKMNIRKSLFWDVDPESIDFKKNAQYVIERVLDYGHDNEILWLWKTYDKTLLRKTVYNSRSLRPNTKTLWTLLLNN